MTPDRCCETPWSRLVWGACVLAAGVIFWLDHLHRIEAHDYLQWWSVALIAFGVANALERRWTGAFILTVLGLVFLPHVPFLPHVNIAYVVGLWPLLISIAGVTLIVQSLKPAIKDGKRAGAFRAIAVMGGSGRTIATSDFAGGDAIAVMGGCEIDLTSAKLTREAIIDVLAFWGGIGIKVPRGWVVEYRVASILGAVVNKTSAVAGNGSPRLVVRGSAIMGGIEVKEAV